MRKEDPLPAANRSHDRTFQIGRDRRGRWVVQDSNHLCGGLFVSRAAALKFALSESGHRSEAVFIVADRIELDFGPAVSCIPRMINHHQRAA